MKAYFYPMKALIVAISIAMTACIVSAQDMISMRNGDIIKAIIREISKTEIKYNKHSNPNGPIFIADKDDVLSILYANGEQETFSKLNITKENSSPNYEEPIPDEENDLIKNEVNILYNNEFKVKNKAAKTGVPIMWITDNSIVSTSDLSMRIVGTLVKPEGRDVVYVRYFIELSNKTQKNIYIDKVNSFKIDNNGLATSFYDNKITSISNSHNSGVGIGLGSITNALGIGGAVGSIANGISIGGSASHGKSTTYADENILIIPPRSKRYISEERYDSSNGKLHLISEAESYMFDVTQISLKEGEIREFNQETSPYNINYQIIYSKSPEFRSYSSLNICLFARYIIGKSVRVPLMRQDPRWKECFDLGEKDFIKTYNKVIPNIEKKFGKIIIGRDYTEQQSFWK